MVNPANSTATGLSPGRLSEADDATLSGRAADGDTLAFEVLVRRYGPLMRAFATRILGSTDEVDDVVQDTFITVWQQLPSLETHSAVKSWMMTILNRKAIDLVRSRSRHPLDSLDDQEASLVTMLGLPEPSAEADSIGHALSAALSALPADQRRCWVLREISGYSYSDIAGQLELPVSTVRGLLARARRTLITELEAWR